MGDFSYSSGESLYSDFTGELISLTPGESYPLAVNLGGSATWYKNWYSVWIDFNRDGDFDDSGEQVYQGLENRQEDTNGTISIPSDVGLVTTRMRVTVKWRTMYAAPAPEPCEIFHQGEVEDYTVSIHGLEPVTCDSDLDLDFDVDGADLAQYAAGSGPDLSVFANEFGSPDCR
jgi:hypothetical protein